MKIVICGEIFSENLGDGIISDSNEFLLGTKSENTISFLDLSGRSDYKKVEKAINKNALISSIKSINRTLMTNRGYSSISFLTYMKVKGKKDLEEYYTQKIAGSDLIWIGGGQLIMDNNLSFPYRLKLISEIASNLGIPFVIDSVGVSRNWSKLGKKYFTKTFENNKLVSFSVRDEKSLENLKLYYINFKKNVSLSPDPAIFSNETYCIKKNEKSKTIGLGITNVNSLIFGSNSQFDMNEKSLINIWKKVIIDLTKDNHTVELFTNGSQEDQNFALKIQNELENEKGISVFLYKKPITPKDLVEIISGFKVVVAHRLHANIVAYSLMIPSIGLGWDDKVNEFGKIIKRENTFIQSKDVSSENIIDKVNIILKDEIDEKYYKELKETKKKNIKDLMELYR